MTSDPVEDAVRMVQDLVVGQTRDDEASRHQPSVAAAVSQGLGVERSKAPKLFSWCGSES